MRFYIVSAAIVLSLLASQLFAHKLLSSKLEAALNSYKQQEEKVLNLSSELKALKREMAVIESQTPAQATEKVISPANYKPNKSLLDDPFVGSKESPILMMAFLDYQCKPCRAFANQTFKKLKSKFFSNNRAQFVLRDFPLSKHQQANTAANFAHCAGEQGLYWDAFELLYKESSDKLVFNGDFAKLTSLLPKAKKSKLSSCLRKSRYDQEIRDDKQDGKSVGAVGAPGFFIGLRNESGIYRGVFIRGAQPFAIFEKQIVRFEEVA